MTSRSVLGFIGPHFLGQLLEEIVLETTLL